jgi:hypothetical protein
MGGHGLPRLFDPLDRGANLLRPTTAEVLKPSCLMTFFSAWILAAE